MKMTWIAMACTALSSTAISSGLTAVGTTQALHGWHSRWSNNLGTSQISCKRQLHCHHLASFSLSFLGLPHNNCLHKPSRLCGGMLRKAATRSSNDHDPICIGLSAGDLFRAQPSTLVDLSESSAQA